MSPQLLLLYLRSEDFLRQVDGLRKGATVAHVTPSVLLKEVQVPIVALADQAALNQTYEELCRLEGVIAAAETQTKALRESLWPLPVEASR
jgi:tryptophan synthase beta subunit